MILSYFLTLFIGYAIGRLLHIYDRNFWGDKSGPHHWLLGVMLFLPVIFFRSITTYSLFFLGIGIFISDLNDFFECKFWGKDEPGPKRFWGID